MKSTIRKIILECQILLLLTILFVFAMFQGGFVSWFLFYSMLPILLYVMILPFYPLHKWQIARNMSNHYMQAGNKVDIEITIKRRVGFPIFYLIVEEELPESIQYQDVGKRKYQSLSTLQLYQQKRTMKKVIYLGFRRRVTLPYSLQHLPRGNHQLRHLNVTIGDLFGLIESTHRFDREDNITVYPAVHDMKLSYGSLSIEEGATSVHSLEEKRANVVSGVREYISGDRFSWIDWKTSARKNKVMTKEFEQEKDADFMLILDVNGIDKSKQILLEAAIEWTTSILEMSRKKEQQLSLYVWGKQTQFFPSATVQFQFPAIQHYFATIQPEDSEELTKSNQLAIQEVSKGTSMIFVTCHLDEKIVDRFINWKKAQTMITICYIKSEKKEALREKEWIKALQLKNIKTQIITEKQLLADKWEVTASL